MELLKDFYVGVVEDNKDPNRKGRIKVRVQTLYNDLPLDDIPYAAPFGGLAGKEFQVPAIGKLVNVLFLTNDLYDPYYIFSENYNVNLQNKIKDLSEEEYVRFNALLFDDRTQIFADSNELTLDHYFNKMTVSKWGINLELKDKKQKLNLGSKGADQDAVLGSRFFEWMDEFIDELSNPFSLIGNIGYPVTKGNLESLCAKYKSIRNDPTTGFVSKHVKIVDNNKVDTLERDTVPYQHDPDLIIPPDANSAELMNNINNQTKGACGEISDSAPKGVGTIPDESDIPEPSNSQAVFKVVRYKFMEDRTIGRLYINNKLYCDTLEDKVRNLAKEKKVFGQTAIPYGVYKLTIGPTGLSKKTAPTGRAPEVNSVPYFEGVRIHKWGRPEDTEGCLLVGQLDSTGTKLINYDKVAADITALCEKYQKKGITMTIAYTKDLDTEDTTPPKTYNGAEYVDQGNADTTAASDPPCITSSPDSSWSTNMEMQDYSINGEQLKYEGDLLITAQQLRNIIPQATKTNIERFLMPINITLKRYKIDTPLKIAAFISQIAHESGSLQYTKELGGPSYFKRYEGRRDLGNTSKGDGIKYHGRGILQVTGKSNYQEQSKALGQDFIKNPEMLENPLWACISAGLWWAKRANILNPAIANKDIKKISKTVNGGTNGLSERTAFWKRALKEFKIV